MPASMLFNSINYFLFLSAVFILNYIVPDRFRWILLLLASTFFYMIAGVATIIVPIVIILSTFICGILIERSSKTSRKKTYFLLGLFINLGLLVFFKCINFFIATAFNGFNFINRMVRGEQAVNHTPIILQLVVPLGISYITFQAIGYLIEINRGNQNSEKNLGLFATYLMFFPKLLSGPIERAHNFIPQLRQKHEFNYEQVVEGLKRILWGLFLKLVVANRLALYTDAVFNNFGQHSGITLLVASIFFTIQLFADFAGYTDMAIGSAQILGYRLMENFNSPFIAESITEFWRRWHISLTTWVNEYIYNPIVINCRSWNKWAVVFAAMVTFLILGFWHGASWNYIIFGFLQGIALSVEFLSRRFRKRVRSKIPTWLNTVLGISFTFGYFTFSLIFFKVATVKDAFYIVDKIFSFNGPFYFENPSIMIYSLFSIFLLILVGLISKFYHERISLFNNKSWIVRNLSYALLITIIMLIGVFDGGQFIYFQF
jgi:alginate O-acetyltransferase complex protein AlgI